MAAAGTVLTAAQVGMLAGVGAWVSALLAGLFAPIVWFTDVAARTIRRGLNVAAFWVALAGTTLRFDAVATWTAVAVGAATWLLLLALHRLPDPSRQLGGGDVGWGAAVFAAAAGDVAAGSSWLRFDLRFGDLTTDAFSVASGLSELLIVTFGAHLLWVAARKVWEWCNRHHNSTEVDGDPFGPALTAGATAWTVWHLL